MRRVRTFLPALGLVAAALVLVAACGDAGASGTPGPTIPAGAVVVTAENRHFSPETLMLPAGTTFTLALDNKDGDPHNVAIRTKQGFDGDLLFRHDPITKTIGVFQVGPIAAGTYYFLCEVHPDMHGTVVVQ